MRGAVPPPAPALSRHLWSWSFGLLALAWMTLVAVSYYTGLHEADEITDGQLVSAAALALVFPEGPGAGGGADRGAAGAVQAAISASPAIPEGDRTGYVQDVALLAWHGDTLVHDSHGLAGRLPRDDGTGFSTVQARDGGHRWRRYVVHDAARDRRVAVLIDLDDRKALGRDIAEHIARPALIVLPVVALLSWWTIRRGLRPLHRLSQQIQALDRTGEGRLSVEHRFAEIDITVDAINGLIDRIDAQTEREREFASDVAHELRSPLATIALQAEAAGRAQAAPAERAAALAQLREASHGAARVLTQLLDLARARRVDVPAQPVDLVALAATVLAGFAQRSHDGGHELELVAPPHGPVVHGNPLMLELALRNLLDNALRHTPAGTRVCVSVAQSDAGIELSVLDDADAGAGADAGSGSGTKTDLTPAGAGPGDAGAARSAAGLGIGLKLVARIADWHHARFDRSPPSPPWRTRFALCWPPPSPSPSPPLR